MQKLIQSNASKGKLLVRPGPMLGQPARTDGTKIDELPRFTGDKINNGHGGNAERCEQDGMERHILSMSRGRRRCNRGLLLGNRRIQHRGRLLHLLKHLNRCGRLRGIGDGQCEAFRILGEDVVSDLNNLPCLL